MRTTTLALLAAMAATGAAADPCSRVDPLDAWGVARLGPISEADMDQRAARTKYCHRDANDDNCVFRGKDGTSYVLSEGNLGYKEIAVSELRPGGSLPFDLVASDTPETAAAKIKKRTGVTMTQRVAHDFHGVPSAALGHECELGVNTKRWLVVKFDTTGHVESVGSVIGHPGD